MVQNACHKLLIKAWYRTAGSNVPATINYRIDIGGPAKVETLGKEQISSTFSWDRDGLLQTIVILDTETSLKRKVYNRLFLSGDSLFQTSESSDPITGDPDFTTYEYTRSHH